jgi:hypothetical protein
MNLSKFRNRLFQRGAPEGKSHDALTNEIHRRRAEISANTPLSIVGQLKVANDIMANIVNGWIVEMLPVAETEPTPEKLTEVEGMLHAASISSTPLADAIRKIESAGYYEFDVDGLIQVIEEDLSEYPKYRFKLEIIDEDSTDFKAEFFDAPPKVRKQYDDAKRLGVFEYYEILKVKKVPDPILIGYYKGIAFEITRWS